MIFPGNTDELAFLRAIAEKPEDDTLRLVYADWLQEQGADDPASYIRLNIAIDSLTAIDDEREVLSKQLDEIGTRLPLGTFRPRCPVCIKARYHASCYLCNELRTIGDMKRGLLHSLGIDFGLLFSYRSDIDNSVVFSEWAIKLIQEHPYITSINIFGKNPTRYHGHDNAGRRYNRGFLWLARPRNVTESARERWVDKSRDQAHWLPIDIFDALRGHDGENRTVPLPNKGYLDDISARHALHTAVLKVLIEKHGKG